MFVIRERLYAHPVYHFTIKTLKMQNFSWAAGPLQMGPIVCPLNIDN